MMIAGIKILFCLGFALAAENVTRDPNQADASITHDSETIRQQVERQRMSAIEPNQPTRSDILKQVVTQLQALELSAESTPPSASQAAEKKPKEENKTAAGSSFGQATSLPPGIGDKKESGAVQTTRLNEIENPINPMATADSLYRAKDYRHAVRFYQIAAQAAGKDAPEGYQWALYQTANCLRYEDADKAIAAYQRLIAEFPSSSWAAAALIQQRNLEWLKQNQAVLPKTKITNDPNR